VIGQWSNYDPEQAANWAVTFPEGKLRERALQQVAQQWGAYAPSEAGPWLQSLPEGPSRDQAVGSFSGAIASTYPEMAVQWAETMSDTRLRDSRLESVARQWLRADADAARSWITQSPLPDARKAALLGISNPTKK
jgi:hypothetical protein